MLKTARLAQSFRAIQTQANATVVLPRNWALQREAQAWRINTQPRAQQIFSGFAYHLQAPAYAARRLLFDALPARPIAGHPAPNSAQPFSWQKTSAAFGAAIGACLACGVRALTALLATVAFGLPYALAKLLASAWAQPVAWPRPFAWDTSAQSVKEQMARHLEAGLPLATPGMGHPLPQPAANDDGEDASGVLGLDIRRGFQVFVLDNQNNQHQLFTKPSTSSLTASSATHLKDLTDNFPLWRAQLCNVVGQGVAAAFMQTFLEGHGERRIGGAVLADGSSLLARHDAAATALQMGFGAYMNDRSAPDKATLRRKDDSRTAQKSVDVQYELAWSPKDIGPATREKMAANSDIYGLDAAFFYQVPSSIKVHFLLSRPTSQSPAAIRVLSACFT